MNFQQRVGSAMNEKNVDDDAGIEVTGNRNITEGNKIKGFEKSAIRLTGNDNITRQNDISKADTKSAAPGPWWKTAPAAIAALVAFIAAIVTILTYLDIKPPGSAAAVDNKTTGIQH